MQVFYSFAKKRFMANLTTTAKCIMHQAGWPVLTIVHLDFCLTAMRMSLHYLESTVN